MGRRILISGASGLVGKALTSTFQNAGDQVFALLRSSTPVKTPWWNPREGIVDLGNIGALDAVIHLAGNGIGDQRWTKAHKAMVMDSRVDGTKLLCKAITQLPEPPKTLISASAVGIYGDRGDEILEESSSPGRGFLAEVCTNWEGATAQATASDIRVIHARIGVVLDAQGGALKKMLTPFRLGLGGRLGSGSQYMSWLSLRDIVGMMDFLIEMPDLAGPVNLVSPHPIQNLELTRQLGKALHRPTLFPLPAFLLRGIFGEMADELFLASTRAVPTKLLQAGYEFQDVELRDLLKTLL